MSHGPSNIFGRPTTLCVLAGALVTLSASTTDAQEPGASPPAYSYATKGIVEIKKQHEHWKVLLDDSNLGGKELEIVELRLAAGRDVGRHRHGSLEVFYVLSGTLGHEVNGQAHLLTPGMVGIVRPGDFVRHFVPKESDVKVLVIWTPGGEAKRLLRDYAGGTPIEQK